MIFNDLYQYLSKLKNWKSKWWPCVVPLDRQYFENSFRCRCIITTVIYLSFSLPLSNKIYLYLPPLRKSCLFTLAQVFTGKCFMGGLWMTWSLETSHALAVSHVYWCNRLPWNFSSAVFSSIIVSLYLPSNLSLRSIFLAFGFGSRDPIKNRNQTIRHQFNKP